MGKVGLYAEKQDAGYWNENGSATQTVTLTLEKPAANVILLAIAGHRQGISRLFFAPHRVALVKSPGRFPFLSHPRRGGGGLIADLSVRLWVPPRSD